MPYVIQNDSSASFTDLLLQRLYLVDIIIGYKVSGRGFGLLDEDYLIYVPFFCTASDQPASRFGKHGGVIERRVFRE